MLVNQVDERAMLTCRVALSPPQEMLSGVVVISGKDSVQHQGLSLTVEGTVNLQLSAKSVGVFEAFYNSVKVRMPDLHVFSSFSKCLGLVCTCCLSFIVVILLGTVAGVLLRLSNQTEKNTCRYFDSGYMLLPKVCLCLFSSDRVRGT